MTNEARFAIKQRIEGMLWWARPPLPSGIREIWWEATGLRATIDEHGWGHRLHRACDTPRWGARFDRDDATALAAEFIIEDGGQSTPELVEAAADALWRMTAVPPLPECPQRYPPEP